ncbi:hypothetical protein ACU7M0_37955, partial [Burkholderia cenocepacia]
PRGRAAGKLEGVARLAAGGVLRLGLPAGLGGGGGTAESAVAGSAGGAEHELTAAFVLGDRRRFTEDVAQGANAAVRARWQAARRQRGRRIGRGILHAAGFEG